ncbi:MAG: IS21 family transposase [Candidatus Aminicenantaceae bacterium]
MAKKRLSMRKIREVLRLKHSGLSVRAIGRACSVGRETVREYLCRAQEAGIGWPLPEGLDDEELERRLFSAVLKRSDKRSCPNWALVHQELRKKGVTRQLLWTEYKEEAPDFLGYSQFCELYRRWGKQLHPTMRVVHKAGEKLFVDFAGLTMAYTDPSNGEVKKAYVFVATWGASNYTYAEAFPCQTLTSWISGHIHAFEYFCGVPRALVPDNAKVGVTSPCYYEPDLNPTYQELARHYGTVVLPTRVRAPKDKAKVEKGVQTVEYWLIAPLRKRQFFSIDEINQALWEGLEGLNTRPMQHFERSRKEMFEELDQPVLKPLPQTAFEIAEWKRAKVGIDYHVEFKKHYYSVPYTLIQKPVDIRATDRVVEVFYKTKRISSHKRDDTPGRHSTHPEHMPEAHRLYAEWNPERFFKWAERTGEFTVELVSHIFSSRRHPEQGYRSCLGLMRLETRYGKERMEAASKRALFFSYYSYKGVKNILEAGLDQVELEEPVGVVSKSHPNIRGTDYYS